MSNDSDAREPASDQWSDWLLGRRHGNDDAYQVEARKLVEHYRDRVLDGARLAAGMVLADIGTGDGLIALGAIQRIGPSLRVIATDVSLPLLLHTEKVAARLGVAKQCSFLCGSAERLDGIDDASVDALTTRSVLAYVSDRPAAFAEFYRVLKPGGRLSIFEPVFQDDAFEACALSKLLLANPNRPNAGYLRWRCRILSAQFHDTVEETLKDPITNYNERDLFRLARDARFAELHVELHIESQKKAIISWTAYLDTAVHPQAPTLREIVARYSESEQKEFERIFRPIVETSAAEQKGCYAYLVAMKPRRVEVPA